MYQPTPQETAAYTHMQARLIGLLLRHDSERFRHAFTQHPDYDTPPDEGALLRHYRELGVLFALRDDLFDHILPRIVRRLSFEAPRNTSREEPPARGRIDWERTLDAIWDERPDQPPLVLHTHQRFRDFATPENLLTVTTLLDYQADVQAVLQQEYLDIGESALRHPLHDIVARCERELAFPQFAALRQHLQHQHQHHDTDDDEHDARTLEERVRQRLLPGSNRAYDDLLTWRQQRRALRLLQRTRTTDPSPVLGADPRRDNYLYQLWLFYELVDVLHQAGALIAVNPTPGQMCLHFHWGDGDTRCCYELRHDQGVPDPVAWWETSPPGNVPGVRPDFLLRRTDPPPQRVTHQGECIWREPGVIWDAKYYRERESPRVPSPPLKRMLADLTLLGETSGVLLFAFLKAPDTAASEHAAPDTTAPESLPHVLRPAANRNQTLIPDMQIESHCVQPVDDRHTAQVATLLCTLLDTMHASLHRPRVPRCLGVFLDSLSTNNQTPYHTRDGALLPAPSDEWLVCPKPHIGHWRVDLVSRQRHCHQDARLCHINGQPDTTRPVRPPRTMEDVLTELHHIVEQRTSPLTEDDIHTIAEQVEHLTRQFATIAGAYRRIEVYYHRLRDMGMHRTWHLLDAAAQESLALAVFLVEQLDTIGASDYSAPAIHVSGVLERAIQQRVFGCPTLVGDVANPKRQTLGTLPYLRRAGHEQHEAQENWQHIVAYTQRHWQGHRDPDDPEAQVTFDNYVKQLPTIADLRNKAAHTNPLPRQDYNRLFELVCQRGKWLRFGALNDLLLAWKVPQKKGEPHERRQDRA